MAMLDHETIVIQAPVGTKTRWVRQSQAQHRKLSDWIVEAVDQPDDTAATEATTKAAQTLAMAVQDLREALTHANAVQGLALLDLIQGAYSLAHKTEALAQAMQQDNTPRSEP